MNKWLLTTVLSLTICGSALAVDPPDVPANVSGKTGEFVIIVAKSKGKTTKFVSLDSGLTVFPSQLLKDQNTAVVISNGAGTYRVLAYTAESNEPSEPAYITVTIGPGPLPVPSPVPPGPTPPGPGPVGFGLKAVSQAGLAKTYTDPSVTKSLANAQRGLAAAVAAGAYKTPADILAAWREVNKPFGASVWGEWGKLVSAKIQETYKQGLLKTNQDWAEAFREIADGLDGGK